MTDTPDTFVLAAHWLDLLAILTGPVVPAVLFLVKKEALIRPSKTPKERMVGGSGRLKKLLIFAAVAACSFGLAGCSSAAAEATSHPPAGQPSQTCPIPTNAPLALAVSRRANSPSDFPPEVRLIVERFIAAVPAQTRGPRLSLINVDGVPQLYKAGEYQPTAENQQARDDQDQEFLADFEQVLAEMRADDPEVDVLTSLEKAAVAARRPGPATLVLVDNGLSTKGVLNFTVPGVLDASPKEIVAFLRAQHAIPDLTGLTVILVGLGDVARPQAELGFRQRAIQDLWSAIARETAACVTTLETLRRPDPLPGSMPVTIVPVTPPVVYEPHGRVVLPDVAFDPGQASLRDPARVRRLLEPVARRLQSDPSLQLLLTGTTARWGSRAYQVDLAARRVAKVRQELITISSVAPDRIQTQALGSYFDEYTPDHGPGGVLLPGPAQRNRTVRIDECRPDCPRQP